MPGGFGPNFGANKTIQVIIENIIRNADKVEAMTTGYRRMGQTFDKISPKIVSQAIKQNKANAALARKNKFLREQSERMGITFNEVQKAMGAVDLTFSKTGGVVSKTGHRVGDVNKLMDKGRAKTKGFQFGWLSVMFAGMALDRVFGSLIRSQMQLFGITELFGGTLTLVLLPIMMLLLPFFIWLAQIFMDLPDGVKLAIGIFILLAAILSIIFLVVGQVALAMGGFAVIATIGLGGVALLLLGLVVILIGLAVLIAGVVIIVQNWGKDWGKVIMGIGILLLGLGIIFLGVMAVMAAAGIATGAILAIAMTAGIILIVAALVLLVAFIIMKWNEIKDFTTIVWAHIGNIAAKTWNKILDITAAAINKMIAMLNKLPGIDISPVNLDKYKASLVDIDKLKQKLAIERQNRELKKKINGENKGGFLGGLFGGLFGGGSLAGKDKLFPPEFKGFGGQAGVQNNQQININNENTFNVSDKEEFQKMLDENNAKIVEDIKRQIGV